MQALGSCSEVRLCILSKRGRCCIEPAKSCHERIQDQSFHGLLLFSREDIEVAFSPTTSDKS